MSSWAFVLGDSVLGDFVLGAFVRIPIKTRVMLMGVVNRDCLEKDAEVTSQNAADASYMRKLKWQTA